MTNRAVCWELRTNDGQTNWGLRVLLVGNHVGQQLLSNGNARPRWNFTSYRTAQEAAEGAVKVTQTFERDRRATLAVPPGEIMVHPSEVAGIRAGSPIPASLRARVFTSLTRRDPQGGGDDVRAS